MKLTRIAALAAALVVTLSLAACTSSPAPSGSSTPVSQSTDTPASSTPSAPTVGQVYLYGESHGDKALLEAELELWKGYYGNQAMRHLFVEYPYHTAELLNLWMKSDNDDILEQVYSDWAGTASQNLDVKEFLKQIKLQCPETIFHGTDIGHQYDTTGERYLQYLRDNKQQDTELYKRAEEVIEQGSYYYSNNQDGVYRENKMVENFVYEMDKLGGESVMGIYGAAHTGFAAMEYTTQSVPCMANQLKERYGDAIHSEDLTETVKTDKAQRTDVIEVGGKEYQASYYGKQDLTGFKDYASREFWRLEEAYDDFKDNTKSGDMLPYNNYPMQITTGQVFVIDYTKTDGSVNRMYYRSDGQQLQGSATTEEFLVNTVIDVTAFNTVAKHYEPLDFKYLFGLTDEQQVELVKILQPESWKVANQEELPEYGLNTVLSSQSGEYYLFVSPWNENTTIIRVELINETGDGSDRVCYFAPFEVGVDAQKFMESFEASDMAN